MPGGDISPPYSAGRRDIRDAGFWVSVFIMKYPCYPLPNHTFTRTHAENWILRSHCRVRICPHRAVISIERMVLPLRPGCARRGYIPALRCGTQNTHTVFSFSTVKYPCYPFPNHTHARTHAENWVLRSHCRVRIYPHRAVISIERMVLPLRPRCARRGYIPALQCGTQRHTGRRLLGICFYYEISVLSVTQSHVYTHTRRKLDFAQPL